MYQDGEKHNRSMDDVLDFSQAMPTHAPYEKFSEEKTTLLRSTPAPVQHSPPAHVNGTLQPPALNHSDLHSTSFDTTDYVMQRHGSARYAKSMDRNTHRLDKRIVKSHSAHGHLVGAGKAFSVYSYGLGSLSGRHLSQSELEHLRRSQIFGLLKGSSSLIFGS